MPAIIGYNNLLTTGTVSVSTEATGFEKENAYDWNTYDYWKPTAVPAYLTVDMGSAVSCDYFALAAHDLSDNSASVVLQWSTDDFSADINDAFTAVTPSDNSPIFRSFASLSKRYWRVKLTGGVSSLGLVSFGVGLDLPIGIAPPFDLLTEARKGKVINSRSESGQFLGRSVINEGIKGRLKMDYLTPAWVRTNWPTFSAHAEAKPFFLQWDNTNYEDETALIWLRNSPPTPRYTQTNLLSVVLDFEGIAR